MEALLARGACNYKFLIIYYKYSLMAIRQSLIFDFENPDFYSDAYREAEDW